MTKNSQRAIRGFVRQFWRRKGIDMLGSDFVLYYVHNKHTGKTHYSIKSGQQALGSSINIILPLVTRQ